MIDWIIGNKAHAFSRIEKTLHILIFVLSLYVWLAMVKTVAELGNCGKNVYFRIKTPVYYNNLYVYVYAYNIFM